MTDAGERVARANRSPDEKKRRVDLHGSAANESCVCDASVEVGAYGGGCDPRLALEELSAKKTIATEPFAQIACIEAK